MMPWNRRTLPIVSVILVWIALTASAHGQEPGPRLGQAPGQAFGEACRAEIRGDHATALDLYREAADAGLREAMFALGRYHRDGLATLPDDEAAFRWFLAAAERGHGLARYQVGLAYRDGRGVESDGALAREWLEAAALRHADAAYAVFQLEEEPREKGAWLTRAAELGHRQAMAELSRAFARGEHGLPVSRVEAASWSVRAESAEAEEVQP